MQLVPLIPVPLFGSMRWAATSALGLALASAAVAQPAALTSAASKLQAASTQSVEFSGTGQWFQFGQAPAPGLPWPAFDLTRYSAAVDYSTAAARVQSTRRQVVEPLRMRPQPVDQSVDQYVSGNQAWNRAVVAPGAATPAPNAQPGAVAERSAEIWATPQGFLKAALAHKASAHATAAGTELSFKADGGGRWLGWLNARGEVLRVQTWIDTPVLGDTLVETRFSDYKDFGGLPFPAHIVRLQGGHPVLDLRVAEVRLNPSVSLPVPAEVASAKPPAVTVTSTKLADGVFYLTGGTHHSVAIAQRDHVVLVEAPQDEKRALAVIAKVNELLPAKPIKYLVNTHAHFDHSGGVRTLVDAGAVIVTQQANRPFYEKAWAAPHTLVPDRLAASHKPARFETFADQHVLSDGQRKIEIHQIAGSGHNDAFALVYLPAEKILIEADAYTPVAATAPVPAVPNPYTLNLYQNIVKLKLDVERIAALHGPRVVTLEDLRAVVRGGSVNTAQR
jgi:glyoxylase-like metal-dependent hydrolase (beta-lactamase superfamily II)